MSLFLGVGVYCHRQCLSRIFRYEPTFVGNREAFRRSLVRSWSASRRRTPGRKTARLRGVSVVVRAGGSAANVPKPLRTTLSPWNRAMII